MEPSKESEAFAVDCFIGPHAGQDVTSLARHYDHATESLRQQLAEADARYKTAEFWKNWVYPEGATAEQVQDELHDYRVLMENVPKVYDSVTGGRISKPMTKPEAVISEAEDHTARLVDEAVKEAGEQLAASREREGRWRGLCGQAGYNLTHRCPTDFAWVQGWVEAHDALAAGGHTPITLNITPEWVKQQAELKGDDIVSAGYRGPPIGECLICGHVKPFGAWHGEPTVGGHYVGACGGCRDKARAASQVQQPVERCGAYAEHSPDGLGCQQPKGHEGNHGDAAGGREGAA